MHTRPSWLTDEHLSWMDQFTFSQASEMVMFWMRTYAERHLLNQEDIDEHKRTMRDLTPLFRASEQKRLKKLIARQQTEIDALTAALHGYLEESA